MAGGSPPVINDCPSYPPISISIYRGVSLAVDDAGELWRDCASPEVSEKQGRRGSQLWDPRGTPWKMSKCGHGGHTSYKNGR